MPKSKNEQVYHRHYHRYRELAHRIEKRLAEQSHFDPNYAPKLSPAWSTATAQGFINFAAWVDAELKKTPIPEDMVFTVYRNSFKDDFGPDSCYLLVKKRPVIIKQKEAITDIEEVSKTLLYLETIFGLRTQIVGKESSLLDQLAAIGQ